MILANIEWIGTLCIVLALTCSIQLIITAVLAATIPEILLITGSHISTGAGLVAGFVALPTALQIKTAKISPNMDRTYGYTACYQRLAICISGILHFTATICTIVALIITSNLGDEFMTLMKNYHTKQNSKILVDNIQFALQCCGSRSYDDWFQIDWGGFGLAKGNRNNKRSMQQLLKEDTDAYPDLSLIRFDSVPYSCCAKAITTVCVHQHIIQLGNNSINTRGCGKKLCRTSHVLLWFEFALYLSCLLLEGAILLLIGEDSCLPARKKEDSKFVKRKREKSKKSSSNRQTSAPTGESDDRKRKTRFKLLNKKSRSCSCGNIDSGTTVSSENPQRSTPKSSVRSRSSIESTETESKSATTDRTKSKSTTSKGSHQ